ncbi:MAG: DUF924 domain-containing protein [Gammaproteobacteria bacterium]|nr:DUF924 domain-containing protein [Gammaproteobacteria bacterium]
MAPHDIIDYWFAEPMRKHWFRSTPDLDTQIRVRFEAVWRQAAGGELSAWMRTAQGSLALAIVLDQFPLNMFRGEARSFATETRAIEVVLNAIDRGFDRQLSHEQLAFLYMPLMHSEDLEHQERSVDLFEAAGLESNARFARHHRDLIRRFGRFPHRNAIIGRPSTAEEQAYLASKEAFRG